MIKQWASVMEEYHKARKISDVLQEKAEQEYQKLNG